MDHATALAWVQVLSNARKDALSNLSSSNLKKQLQVAPDWVRIWQEDGEAGLEKYFRDDLHMLYPEEMSEWEDEKGEVFVDDGDSTNSEYEYDNDYDYEDDDDDDNEADYSSHRKGREGGKRGGNLVAIVHEAGGGMWLSDPNITH